MTVSSTETPGNPDFPAAQRPRDRFATMTPAEALAAVLAQPGAGVQGDDRLLVIALLAKLAELPSQPRMDCHQTLARWTLEPLNNGNIFFQRMVKLVKYVIATDYKTDELGT